jgi:hypothetical protein
MNISSTGSAAEYATMAVPDKASATVVGKVLDQEKSDGQAMVDLIDSAGSPTGQGHALSIYA